MKSETRVRPVLPLKRFFQIHGLTRHIRRPGPGWYETDALSRPREIRGQNGRADTEIIVPKKVVHFFNTPKIIRHSICDTYNFHHKKC